MIVRDGRIAAAGARGSVTIPRGMAVVDAKGKTLLPGLWEMHTHFSGVEFGPALLGAGITTARDCGGEFDYLVAQRDAVEAGRAEPAVAAGGVGGCRRPEGLRARDRRNAGRRPRGGAALSRRRIPADQAVYVSARRM